MIVTTGDNRDYFRVLLYSYYTTITRWGVLLRKRASGLGLGVKGLWFKVSGVAGLRRAFSE